MNYLFRNFTYPHNWGEAKEYDEVDDKGELVGKALIIICKDCGAWAYNILDSYVDTYTIEQAYDHLTCGECLIKNILT